MIITGPGYWLSTFPKLRIAGARDRTEIAISNFKSRIYSFFNPAALGTAPKSNFRLRFSASGFNGAALPAARELLRTEN
jgi:hypothetical protein